MLGPLVFPPTQAVLSLGDRLDRTDDAGLVWLREQSVRSAAKGRSGWRRSRRRRLSGSTSISPRAPRYLRLAGCWLRRTPGRRGRFLAPR